ncbi:hypothetical protein AAFA46_04760 [Oscillospiraceae bacterium WX1]
MLFKSNIGKMPYKKVLKIQMIIHVVLILIGLKCLLLVLLNQVGNLQSLTSKFGIALINLSFMQGFYSGFGAALIIAGIVLFIRSVILLSNGEKFQKSEINYLDERNRFIKSITFSTTSYIFLIALTFAVVISGMFNLVVFLTLLTTLFAYFFLLLSTYLIMKVKY